VGYSHGLSEGVGVEGAMEGVGVEGAMEGVGVEGAMEGVGVEVGTGVGVAVGVGVGDFEVTVNVAVAEPPASSVALTIYVPGDTDGTVNSVFIIPELSAYAVAPSDSPKLMLTKAFEANPVPSTLTSVPTGPWSGLIDKVWLCAFATGVIAAAEVNMLRTSSAIVTLANPSFKPTGDFPKISLSRYTNGSLADLKLCKMPAVLNNLSNSSA
jgi:hypothetical protein